MIDLTGIYLTNGMSKSGESFSMAALEEFLWKGCQESVPSNMEHDIHRPCGITRISSLYLSHEMAYLLGHTSVPETDDEFKHMMRVRTYYLNNMMIARAQQYIQDFITELEASGLKDKKGEILTNGIVMFGYENIIYDLFPQLKDIVDNDGLLPLNQLLRWFDYRGDGVFASKNTELALMVHPFLRRSQSRHNGYNKVFLQELFEANSEKSPVRIRIDSDFVGFTPSFIENLEYDYWFGPKFKDDISTIPEGPTSYITNNTEQCFNQIYKTDFVWQEKDGKRQFEMEEVMNETAPTLPEGTYACRYLHAFFDPATSVFDHFDGALRCYDLDLICERHEKPITAMGHRAQYTKLFRIDGLIHLNKWKSMVTHYLKGNYDVYRYFNEPVPYLSDNHESEVKTNPIGKYVPLVLKPDDGVRLLISYQEAETITDDFKFINFDTSSIMEENVEVTDDLSVDLTKLIRREGGKIEYPACRYCCYHDNFNDLTELFHGGSEVTRNLSVSLSAIRKMLQGMIDRGVENCLSFCLSWNVEDRKLKVSFMGAVPDLLHWLSTFTTIPADRAGLRNWIEQQTQYIQSNGKDTPSPINAPYIHPDGIFFHKRRLLQQDVTLKDFSFEDGKGIVASIELPEDNEELKDMLLNRRIGHESFIVADKLCITGTEEDYLASDAISTLGEITFYPTIHFMNLVWASEHNGLVVF
mgnify:CR=1 FL=1